MLVPYQWRAWTISQIFWYFRFAVPVYDLELARAVEILVEHCLVPMAPPPLAQLSVPATGECVEEFRVVEGYKGVQVLISQMALEAILLCLLCECWSRQVSTCKRETNCQRSSRAAWGSLKLKYMAIHLNMRIISNANTQFCYFLHYLWKERKKENNNAITVK